MGSAEGDALILSESLTLLTSLTLTQRSTELRQAQLPRGSAERSPSKPHAEVSAWAIAPVPTYSQTQPIRASDLFLHPCVGVACRRHSLLLGCLIKGASLLLWDCQTELKALHHRALAVMLEVGEILGFHLTEIVVARSYLQLADKQ